MQLYRQKSQTIEAVQFDPKQHPWPDGVISWEGKPRPRDMSWGYIDTDEGRIHIQVGDWIVYGASGKPHVCKPAIFEATYEPVDAMLDAPTYDKIYQQVVARITNDLKKQIRGNL